MVSLNTRPLNSAKHFIFHLMRAMSKGPSFSSPGVTDPTAFLYLNFGIKPAFLF